MGEIKLSKREMRALGAHPEKVSRVTTIGRRNVPVTQGRGMFDQGILSPEADIIDKKGFESAEVRAYFKGRELPTAVWIPTGAAYYAYLEDIPTEDATHRVRPKIESVETRAAIALKVCPVSEGEPPDASFKFVGERGLYVRVIRGDKEITVDDETKRVPIISWTPFNEEDVDPRKVRRV